MIRLNLGGAVNVKGIKVEFEKLYNLFIGSEYQDAQEFISLLLDSIHEATCVKNDEININEYFLRNTFIKISLNVQF